LLAVAARTWRALSIALDDDADNAVVVAFPSSVGYMIA
jgi:hypothetical protein